MAKLSSSNEVIADSVFSRRSTDDQNPKHLVKQTVHSAQLGNKTTEKALQKSSKPWEANLDSINLFNPPKSNPNGRLAASKLFDRALKATTTHKKGSQLGIVSNRELEGTIPMSWGADKDFTSKPPKNAAEHLNFWRIGAISLILLVNILSAFAILKDKFFQPIGKQELAPTPEILAGKTNLAAQEFITPNLNSLRTISTTVKGDNKIESDVQSKVSLPLAIPPTNLPNKGIISSSVTNIPYYYILVEYTGEESLELAQEQVKNVSLVNFPQGIFIYLGAFSQKASAEKFVNKIKKTGLNGYIYHTD